MRASTKAYGLLVILMAVGTTACETLKPYEKEYLLDPTMDDAAVSALNADMMVSGQAGFEKLGLAGQGGAGATSCPTCGG